MTALSEIKSKITDWNTAAERVADWRGKGQRVVFTNGCFDLLHYGHVHYLAEAKALGDRLVIGVNSASSVARLKGDSRPVNDDATRLHLLAAMGMVDMVVPFGEDTPLELIRRLSPDVLVKGGDYRIRDIVGYQEVTARGGEVRALPFKEGYSSSRIIQKIRSWED